MGQSDFCMQAVGTLGVYRTQEGAAQAHDLACLLLQDTHINSCNVLTTPALNNARDTYLNAAGHFLPHVRFPLAVLHAMKYALVRMPPGRLHDHIEGRRPRALAMFGDKPDLGPLAADVVIAGLCGLQTRTLRPPVTWVLKDMYTPQAGLTNLKNLQQQRSAAVQPPASGSVD